MFHLFLSYIGYITPRTFSFRFRGVYSPDSFLLHIFCLLNVYSSCPITQKLNRSPIFLMWWFLFLFPKYLFLIPHYSDQKFQGYFMWLCCIFTHSIFNFIQSLVVMHTNEYTLAHIQKWLIHLSFFGWIFLDLWLSLWRIYFLSFRLVLLLVF